MDLHFSPADEAFRAEVREFLADALTPELRQITRRMTSVYAQKEVGLEWQAILHEKGWAAPSWPVDVRSPRLPARRVSDHRISGGSIETELNELTVMPMGARPVPIVVTTATPVGKLPSARRSPAGSERPPTIASALIRQARSPTIRTSVTVRLSAMREGMKKGNGKTPAIAAAHRGCSRDRTVGRSRSGSARLSRRHG